MKYQLFILLVVILPFASLSCNNTNKSSKEVVKKTNLQQLIKSNQSNSSINWITLAELEEKTALNPKKAIFLFTKKGCPYCKEMKETTLSDPDVIELINKNYYAVMLDGKSKEPITFKGITYINDAPIDEDPKSTWRHNLFAELVEPYNGGYYWPSTVIFDKNLNKIKSFPGSQKPAQFKRLLTNYIR